MKINRKIEKMFIQEQNKFDDEVESIFYQKESNTLDYYELDNHLELLDAAITNSFACEYYLSHAYKNLREYLRINNSLSILGATKDDPQIVICIELIKNLNINVNNLKKNLLSYYIFLCGSMVYKPSKVHNQTLQATTYYSNQNKNLKTPEMMFNSVIKSLFRSELCFEAIDHLITLYFENHSDEIHLHYDDSEFTNEIEKIYPNLLENYLELKMQHLMLIDI